MKEKNKKNESRISAEIIKKSLRESWAAHKALWIIGIVVAVVLIAYGSFSLYAKTATFQRVVLSAMIPNEIVATTSDEQEFKFYYEKNPEFDKKAKIEVIDSKVLNNMFKFYYLDENGEKVYLEDGLYSYKDSNGDEKKISPFLTGLIEVYEKYTKVQKISKIIGWIILAAGIVGLIILWYIKDKQYQEKQMARAKRPRKSKK